MSAEACAENTVAPAFADRPAVGPGGGAGAGAGVCAGTERVGSFDWARLEHGLQRQGSVVAEEALTHEECDDLTVLYSRSELFRSKVVMARHGFGSGEYQYFSYPLPPLVEGLREAFYSRLAPIANGWNEQMRVEARYPATHAEFLGRCREAGQARPTPLLLRYREGDYNCLHQDVYGESIFPLQLTVLLSEPARDFTGGEFVITEQRPRMQSRAEVVHMSKGDAVIFAVRHRPVKGTRGVYRVNLRHGVSRIRSGQRHALGIIFHDAK